MKRARFFLVLAFWLVVCAKSSGGGEVALTADRKVVDPGQTLAVQFKAPAPFEAKAWVGIVPPLVARGSEGTLTFKAPGKPGSYDFRMNGSDSDGREVASVTFAVK
jgi:hypothetical protein